MAEQFDRTEVKDRIAPGTLEENPAETVENQKGLSNRATAALPRLQRSQIRAAVNFTRPLQSLADSPTQPNPIEIGPNQATGEQKARAEEIATLVEKADFLTRSGDHERARQLYSQAVRLAPDNSEAWCGLGMLLMKPSPERAQYCLQRALKLDPENKLALLLLQTVEEDLKQTPKPASTELAPVPETTSDKPSTVAATENIEEKVVAKTDDSGIKVGLEEVLAKMGEEGTTDPKLVPVGGALFQKAIEKGALVPGRLAHRPRPRRNSNRLTLIVGLLLAIGLAGGGFFIYANYLRAKPATDAQLTTGVPLVAATTSANFTTTNDTNATGPVAPPLSTASSDDVFAAKLRVEIDRYNRFLTGIKSLVDQQQANRLQWEDFRKSFDDLQKQLRDEKKNLDGLAATTTPRLLNSYKQVQDLAQTMGGATDYMVSGIHNYEPDDLDEALLQYNRASTQLVDLVKELDKVVPVPTPSPAVTPNTLSQTAPISASPATSATASILNPTVTISSGGETTVASSPVTTTPPVSSPTPAP